MSYYTLRLGGCLSNAEWAICLTSLIYSIVYYFIGSVFTKYPAVEQKFRPDKKLRVLDKEEQITTKDVSFHFLL